MRSIFVVEDSTKLFDVYNVSILLELRKIAGLETNEYFNSKKIRNAGHIFSDVEYIFSTWYMPVFSEAEVKQFFPNLKAIFYAAGSVKYFAESFLKAGVKVFSAASANAIPVAEFVVAQIILSTKGYFQAQLAYKKGFYKIGFNNGKSISQLKPGNYNCKIGIVGAGLIGQYIVKLLKPYNLDVYICDPYISDEKIDEIGCKRMTLDQVFSECDVISSHLPDNNETRGVLNYSLFSKMKPTATFINTGRGAQVNERDLARVMKKKPNACALLDVTKREPLLPHSSLLRRRNIFISPHIAGSQSNEEWRMAEYILESFKNFKAKKESVCQVTLEMLEKMA
jgi:phosphoglycerate dehydrogenase-like enzyme